MTKDELADFVHSREEGLELNRLIAGVNIELLHALSPRILDGTYHKDYIMDWIYDKLCGLVAEADDILRSPRKGEPELSGPMRKFAGREPLTVMQTVIIDAVRSFGNRGFTVGALKLICGAFRDDYGHPCSLADATAIYDAIMEREEL